MFHVRPGVCALVLGACLSARCDEVSSVEAREAVAGWAALGDALTEADIFGGRQIAGVATYDGADGNGRFHVVSFSGGGYAVTSADTGISPILAYSAGGEFVASAENPLWSLLAQDVAGRTKNLEDKSAGTAAAKAGGTRLGATAATSAASSWARLRAAASGTPAPKASAPGRKRSVADLRAGPLCKTLWSQSDARGGHCYNYYTPSNVVCGCTATAFAQIMKCFEWPKDVVKPAVTTYSGKFTEVLRISDTKSVTNVVPWHVGGEYGDTWEFGGPPFGGYRYDWGNMKNDPAKGELTEAQRRAIGLLCRDCGIVTQMSYKPWGSGGLPGYMKLRLVDQFGYKNAVFLRGVDIEKRLAAMVASFDLGSPCAVQVPGHEIVSDGYGSTDGRLFIHFNWGWGDTYETAWYAPPEADEENSVYPTIENTVYNIYTPEMCDEANRTVVSGRVTGEDGEPLQGVVVKATDGASGAKFCATTGETGVYAFLLPPERTYTISAEKVYATDGWNGVWRAKTVRDVKKTVSKTVNPDGTLSGTAVVSSLPFTDLALERVPAGDEWLDEDAAHTLQTGTWAGPVEYGADGRALLEDDNAFRPYNVSTGNVVTVETTAQFWEYAGDDAPVASSQAAVRIGANGSFQIWTRKEPGAEGGGAGETHWVDVAAEGVAPVSGAEYTLRTTLDYTKGSYGVEVKTGSTEWTRLVGVQSSSSRKDDSNSALQLETPTSSFPLAAQADCVTSIGFVGDTLFTSLLGSCAVVATGFVEDERLVLANASVILSEAQAAWLNRCSGGRNALVASVQNISSNDFANAYLLNLDIAVSTGSTFKITGIRVGGDSVEVDVTLVREAAVKDGGNAAPIKGRLNFYGAATLAAFRSAPEKLGGARLANETFGGGETATATIPLEGENPPVFFNAKIEED